MTYVYLHSEPGLYTVGFYKPDGRWEAESDHSDRELAARRTAFLNGTPPNARACRVCGEDLPAPSDDLSCCGTDDFPEPGDLREST